MKFEPNNKIPWATIVYENGEKKGDVIVGLPCDMDFVLSPFNHKAADSGHTILFGQKHGGRPILAIIRTAVLTTPQKLELGIRITG